ncbi:MAG: hypothetical protein II955_06135 [Clostridia bacterium]|nr:hypothetical protein [Clostridia bacterium]
MSGKKWQTVALFALATLCLVAAIVLFVVSGHGDGYKKVLGVICGALLLILSVLFLLYWWLSRDTDPNFFLYNRRTKKNMPLDELTPRIVNDRMTYFLAQIAPSPDLLWSGDVLERKNNFGHQYVYRPLVAYKMLYDMGDKEPDSPYWEHLENASPDVIRIICNTLERVGEKQIVRAFLMIYEAEPVPGPQMKDFLRGNVAYFSGKMYSYVKKHIEYFY